jgi:hypothetical protein
VYKGDDDDEQRGTGDRRGDKEVRASGWWSASDDGGIARRLSDAKRDTTHAYMHVRADESHCELRHRHSVLFHPPAQPADWTAPCMQFNWQSVWG